MITVTEDFFAQFRKLYQNIVEILRLNAQEEALRFLERMHLNYRYSAHAYYDSFFETWLYKQIIWMDSVEKQLKAIEHAIKFLLGLGISDSKNRARLSYIFRTITNGDWYSSFVAKQLYGLIHELATIYVLVSNGCVVVPFSDIQRTIGSTGTKPLAHGDLLVLCCSNSNIGAPVLLEVKTRIRDPSRLRKQRVCGIRKLVAYPSEPIKSIDDLYQTEIIIQDGGDIVARFRVKRETTDAKKKI